MMQTVFVADNPLDPASWQEHETDDIHALLKSIYPVFPATARIYRDKVAVTHDITPRDERTAHALGLVKEKIYVVVYPAWQQVAVMAIMYAVSWVVTELTDKRTPKPRERTFVSGSPNNSLSERSNRARLMERIPDGFGVFRSVPDLIMYTYKVWETHREVEYSWMCVGRGSYGINDIREGDTPFEQIQGASAVIYPPGQLPGGGTPQFIVGENITEPVYNVYPVRAINGQELPPINAFYCYGSGLNVDVLRQFKKWIEAGFVSITASTGQIILPTNGDPDYVLSRIRTGDQLQVVFGALPANGNPIPDLSAGFSFGALPNPPTPGVGIPPVRGDLEALTVTNVVTSTNTQVRVHVNIPASLQSEWAKIAAYSPFVDSVGPGATGGDIILQKHCAVTAQNRWLIGYNDALSDPASRGIFIDDPDCTEIWMNFVAPRGLYVEDGANRKVLRETIAFRIQACDAGGVPTADPPENSFRVLEGSMIGGETRAITIKHVRSVPGRCLLIAARATFRVRQVDLEPITPSNPNGVVPFFRTTTFNLNFDLPGADDDPFPETAFTGQVVDDIQFNECYSMSPLVGALGAAVTTIHSRVVANNSSTRIQERELNCRAFRNTLAWNGSAFTTPNATDVLIENLLFHVMLDPFIGNRNPTEIDFAGIAAAAAQVRAYFGDETATEFSYTLDDDNMSFEETVLIMCRACFLTPYRQGNVIKCLADIATDNSVVLFNHRNKKPGTEQRTRSFGMLNDNDGVEQQYVNEDTGIGNVQPISQFLSQPGVFQPVQSRIVGLRFKNQAWWQAYRQLFRLIHQQVSVEFEGLAEAGLVGINQRILVEDNTDGTVQDGDVVGVSGLVLSTSQPVVAAGGTYTVFLQQPDGSVQAIDCVPGTPDGHSITLAGAPANVPITDSNFGVRTTYMLVRNQDTQYKAFLVTDKQAKDRTLYSMQAVNYSHMYYAADSLNLWIVPSTEIGGEEMFDRSPYERTNLADNTFVGTDPVWGPVYDSNVGFLTNSNILANATAYTKMCWINVNSGTGGAILESATLNEELFAIAAGNLVAGHNATNHCDTPIPGGINIWHHYAVTYDSVTAIMRTFIDGELADTATSVPTRSLATLKAFQSSMHGALDCKAKNLREYGRALTPAMVREHFQKELLQP
jgi:hypothetical protein